MSYTFFIKRVSDFDHLLPLAVKLISNGTPSHEINIYELFPDITLIDIENDFRYDLLIENDLKIKRTFLSKTYLKFLIFLDKFIRNKNIIRYLFVLLNQLTKKIFIFLFMRRLSIIFFLNSFDKIIIDHSNSLFHKRLIKIAKKKKLKIFSLPHGLVLHNGYANKTLHDLQYHKVHKNNFSKLIFINHYHLELSTYLNLKNNFSILGSMRYSKEWIDILKTKVNNNYKKLDNKINILIFEEKVGVNIKNHYVPWIRLKEIERIIHYLLSLKGLNISISKHPSIKDTKLFNNQNLHDCKKSTFEMVYESDIIIGCLTSSICDAITLNKKLIFVPYCHYFNDNLSSFISEDYTANSFEDFKLKLDNHLNKMRENKPNLFQEKFYKKFINNNEGDIFQKYIDELI